MPERARTICNHPGCNRLAAQGERYCDKHIPEPVYSNADKQYDKNRTVRFYYTQRWRNLRNWYISRNPLCSMCLAHNRVTRAEIVDHIKEVKDGGDMWNVDNLQSLCRLCHAEKTNAAALDRGRGV